MVYWLDYSAAKLPAATIKAAGYEGVIRYIDSPGLLRTKHTTLAEYRDHVGAGLKVLLVMQNTTTDADGGFNAGVANARRALAGADYLGYKGPIFFCNDRTTVPNATVWRAYLDGAASVLGKDRTGAYGFFNAMDLAVGHASAFWQAGRRSDVRSFVNFWQDNNFQPKVGGITTDRNLVLKPLTEDNSMANFSEGDVKRIVADVLVGLKGNDGRNVLDRGIQNAWDIAAVGAKVDALAAVLAAATTNKDITLDAIAGLLNEAVDRNLGNIQIELGPKDADK